MPVTNLQRAEKVFAAAVDLTGPERAEHLRAACAGDDDLLAHVQRLLAAHDGAGRFLVEPTLTGALAAQDGEFSGPASDKLGPMIGPYKLLQRIGEGGFGSV